MSTALAQKPKPETDSILSMMAAEYHLDRVALAETLKKTIFPSGTATNEQLAAFVAVAHQYRLNPFLKELYAFPTKGGGVMPVVGVDGWIKLVNRQPELDYFTVNETVDEAGKPYSATCVIYRKDRAQPMEVTEYYAECKRNTPPWNEMPHRMMRHKAFSQCARYAFGFGGIQDEDEARDAVQRMDAETKPAIPVVVRRSVVAKPAPEVEAPASAENLDADPAPVPVASVVPLAEELF